MHRPGFSPLLERHTDRATRAASALSRRGFLGGVGATALAVGAATAGIGLRYEQEAAAAGSCGHACGPSVYCDHNSPDECTSTLQYCKVSTGLSIRRGPYEGFSCVSDTTNNWWHEDYCPGCSGYAGRFDCRDCCVTTYHGSPACTAGTCPSNSWYRCICKHYEAC